MRLAVKHQIILAPAVVLLLMGLLLGFLQYTYWDLSVKRQQAKTLGTVFVSLAEADLASQRIHGLVMLLKRGNQADMAAVKELVELHAHLENSLMRLIGNLELPETTEQTLLKAIDRLDPQQGFDQERFAAALTELRPQLTNLGEKLQKQREELRSHRTQDIDELVMRTTLVSMVVLGAAILIGVLLSLFFARSILRRIQTLSSGAGRIARGDVTPLPAPDRVRDELDDLALSINRMTDKLIRVVGTEKLLEGAEEERRRIAMDIHDQTLSDLSSVLRGLQSLARQEQCRREAAELEEELQRAIANLREVMDNLHPQTLDILGLSAALESHLERYLNRDHLPDYHFYTSPEAESAPLSRLARLTLFRIATEAINNVLKHAGASRYEVNLSRRNGHLVLAVEDNGVGFDLDQHLNGSGRGLNNIRERARAIGAEANWGPSRFHTGTRFELTLPLNDSPSAH